MPRTAVETMRNTLFKHNGTSSPAINPARRAILSIIQNELGWTTSAHDRKTWEHFNARSAQRFNDAVSWLR